MTPTSTALAELNKLRTSQAERNAIIKLAGQIAKDSGYRMIFNHHIRLAIRCVLGAKAGVGR